MENLLAYCSRLVSAARDPRCLTAFTREGVPDSVLNQIDGLWPVEQTRASHQAAPGRLNVALICREYPPETAHGGMATFTYHLAHGLVRDGHRVTVISRGGPGMREDFGGQANVVRINPRPRGGKRSFESLMRRGQLSYARNMLLYSLGAYKQLLALEEVQGKFDVLDLADHGAEGVAPTLFWPGAKTVRLYSPWSLLNSMRANFHAEDNIEEMYVLERAALLLAQVVTSPSLELASRTRTFFGLKQDIAFVPNPLDTDLFRPAERLPGRVRVCFAGRLEVRKGITTLFEAIPAVLARNPEVDFHIVGRDVCSFASTYRASLAADRVLFKAPIPLTELPNFYQTADLAVVPSYYDNSPYTCMEPMACGVPVIGTCTGGIPEYVLHGETGLIIPSRDSGALAGAILQLVADPATRLRMADAARQRMVQLFDYRLVARQMAEQYREAIARSRGGSVPGGNGATQPVRKRLPLGAMDGLRAEVIVLAKQGEGSAVTRTLDSVRRQGRVIQSVTVLWHDAGTPPAHHGCRVFSTHDDLIEAFARTFSTVLTDFFLCLRAGDCLDQSALTKAGWKFVAFEDVGMVSIVVDRQQHDSRGRAVYPVFRSEAVRGLPYTISKDDPGAKELLQFLYEQVLRDGWREAILDEPLVDGREDGQDILCRALPSDESVPLTPLPMSGGPSKWPVSLPIQPSERQAPNWLRRAILRLIRAVSGPRLQPLRSKVRRFLNRREVTRRIAGWFSREKGSLSTGGFIPLDERQQGVIIVAHSVREGLERWSQLRSHESMRSSSPVLVIAGDRCEPVPAHGTTEDIAVYHLDTLLPREYHPHAIQHLLKAYAKSFVSSANGCFFNPQRQWPHLR